MAADERNAGGQDRMSLETILIELSETNKRQSIIINKQSLIIAELKSVIESDK